MFSKVRLSKFAYKISEFDDSMTMNFTDFLRISLISHSKLRSLLSIIAHCLVQRSKCNVSTCVVVKERQSIDLASSLKIHNSPTLFYLISFNKVREIDLLNPFYFCRHLWDVGVELIGNSLSIDALGFQETIQVVCIHPVVLISFNC
jgi:hypothetical protein